MIRYYGLIVTFLLVAAPLSVSSNVGTGAQVDHLIAAEDHLAEGQISPAIAKLKAALRVDPTDVDARYLLGTIYLFIAEGQAAEIEFRAAIEAGMPTESVAQRLGEALLLQRRYQDLLDELSETAPDPYERAAIMALRGRAWAGLGQEDEAYGAYTQAETLAPNSVAPKLGLVRLLVRSGDLAVAEKKVDEALALEPDSRRARLLKAELSRMQGRRADAVTVLNQLIERSPHFVEALLARATALIDLEEFEGASQDIEKALTLNARHPMAFHLSATVLARQGEYEEAYAVLDRAGRSLDSYGPSVFLRGLITYSTNQQEQAVFYLGRLLELAPDHANGRRLLGTIQLQQGRYDRAAQNLEPLLGDLGCQKAAQADAQQRQAIRAVLFGPSDHEG